jgi:hypothetical protein
MKYIVHREFANHKPGDFIEGDGLNIAYLVANGIIEPDTHDDTKPPKPARTNTKKRKD